MFVMGHQQRATIHPARAQATKKAWLEFRLSWSFMNGLKQGAPQSGQSAEAGQPEVDRTWVIVYKLMTGPDVDVKKSRKANRRTGA